MHAARFSFECDLKLKLINQNFFLPATSETNQFPNKTSLNGNLLSKQNFLVSPDSNWNKQESNPMLNMNRKD